MKIIEYPNSLLDLVALHYQGHQKIGMMVRPKEKGIYKIKVTPEHFAEQALEHTLEFKAKDDAPQTVLFDFLDEGINHNQPYLKCTWQLTKEGEDSNSCTDAFSLAWQNIDPKSDDSRIVFWSCHQPYDDWHYNKNKVVLGNNTAAILNWYQDKIKEFSPHTIWGAGDTAYSDAVKSTNFIAQYYNNPHWKKQYGATNLSTAYRRMYQYHWSLPSFKNILQRYPHLFIWDDHEIVDGWGSHKLDQCLANKAMFQVAKNVAKEYILNAGPLVNPKSGETHKSYFSGNMACFVFDTRSTRYYDKPSKLELERIISKTQFDDFIQFVEDCKENPDIRNVIISTSTPFVHLKKAVMSLLRKFNPMNIRDDIRDSWGSCGNLASLQAVFKKLIELNEYREEIRIFNFSGDVHVASAFKIIPEGTRKPIYQITSSALTNQDHPKVLLDWLSRLRKKTHVKGVGEVTRIWKTITEPNILLFTSKPDGFECKLQVKSGRGENKNKHINPKDKELFPIEYK